MVICGAFELKCNFYDEPVRWILYNVYTCNVTELSAGEISSVSGGHLNNRNNNDVKSLEIKRKDSKTMPRRIGEFFPNLEAILIIESGLEEISPEDLSNLPQLLQLDLISNRIREVDGHLFAGNPLISAFSVTKNPVRHVNPRVFEGTNNLTSLHFHETECIKSNDEHVTKDREKVVEYILEVTFRCPPSFSMIQREIERQSKISIEPIMADLSKVMTDVNLLESTVDGNHKEVMKSTTNLKVDIDELSKEMRPAIAHLNDEIDELTNQTSSAIAGIIYRLDAMDENAKSCETCIETTRTQTQNPTSTTQTPTPQK